MVIISACFSGVFVPPLAGPNRMVLTAARPDRTSFGCGEEDRYPYFDTCMLDQLPKAHDFAVLGPAVQACVRQARAGSGGGACRRSRNFGLARTLAPDLPLLAFCRVALNGAFALPCERP